MSGWPVLRLPVASTLGAKWRLAPSITTESRFGRPSQSTPTGPM
jgi:hypothetical protein